METINTPQQEQPRGFMQSTTARVIMTGFLTLALLIPLQYVKSLIWERQSLEQNVKQEIADQWGGSVYFYGPVLKVPYTSYTDTQVIDQVTKKVVVNRTATTQYAYFFPETLNADTQVKTEEKHRNNYKTTVFSSTMNFSGYYNTPDFAKGDIKPENVQWQKATILINTDNLKSIKDALNITLNGKTYAFEPVVQSDKSKTEALETPALALDLNTGRIKFNLRIGYNGTESISMVPIGKITSVKMQSNWPDPKFNGNFLPADKHIDEAKGFTATWKVSHLNRPFVQQYFGSLPNLNAYNLGTEFLIKNNEYQQNERAAKYGFLVIGLTFLIFFLIQTISKIYIHIFQYCMIGLALIMFYTLLISITEHSSFNFAYLISGTAVVSMITLYTRTVLKQQKLTLLIGASLSVLYTFIYVIIQLEDYALLAGSIGLFAILGAVMYFSRKIDWNPTH
ncbi:cell envelope integrity protein CreD [Flavobacterium sp. RHBU_3]|uniref:cell envelope integrity protein CreD n=1 Tax=Flavobacterium sp. RHBU_3 TaxID=3391184 RepID=UPI003984E164